MGKTEQELQQASKDVKYELDMLAAMRSFLSKGRGETDQTIWNAYIESFVLHLRNLMDFYYLSGRKNSLILAEHYVNDVIKWKGGRPAKTSLLKDAEQKANNLAAHLTYERLVIINSNWEWKWAAISADLKHVTNCFLNHLPPAWRAWFEATDNKGPTGPTGTPNPAVRAGTTGPAGPTGFGEATTRG
jgi:hypothetical protein